MIEKINVPDVLTVAGLLVALIMSIFYGMNELAMSIASGLLGYIGGNIKTAATKKEDQK
nr:MAG TPA: hypothetical protein [Caudoviricetes sp.]